jgi:hypothetical protein
LSYSGFEKYVQTVPNTGECAKDYGIFLRSTGWMVSHYKERLDVRKSIQAVFFIRIIRELKRTETED